MATTLAANDTIEATVSAEAFGQTIQNVVSYVVKAVTGTPLLEDFLSAFRDAWRAAAVANLSDAYQATLYEARRVSSVLQQGTTSPVRVRYNAYAALGGAGADQGDKTGAALPTFVGVGAKKISAGPQSTEYHGGAPSTAVLNKEKHFRGGIRFSPIVEADTVSALGNELEAAAVTAWGTATDSLMAIPISTDAVAQMSILSLSLDGLVRETPGGILSVWATQPVTAMAVNLLTTSQVSRKQRVGGE